MLETLDAAAVRRWCGRGLEALRAHQHEIDELNVYPVPDGDTGTNLVLTLASAQEALESFPATADDSLLPGQADGPSGARRQMDGGLSDGLEADGRQVDGLEAIGGPAGGLLTGAARVGGESADGRMPGAAPAEGLSVDGLRAGGGVPVGGSALAGDAEAATPLGRAMRRMARGALLGARGNSGVIVSQILRGMADSFATSVPVRGGELARAFRTAAEAAYGAVARPVEGTVLSVARAAAEGAGRIKSDDLLAVARAAALSAREALARTPQQLPELARAGVVDAGGRGLCLLLDALVDALGPADVTPATNDSPPDAERSDAERSDAERSDAERLPATGLPGDGTDAYRQRGTGDGVAVRASGGPGGGGDAYRGMGVSGFEVQYLLDAEDAAVETLRSVLDGLGDSLVVVGTGDGTWNVHVHVAATGIGPAVEAGVTAGRPHRISVTPLDERAHRDEHARGAVVVAAGDGLTRLFEAEGATVVGRNPSTGEMLAAITSTGLGGVVLLPNDANTHAVAISAAREADRAGIRVSVVPTRSPVQALAALAVRDPGRPFAEDVIAMAEAAGACRYGEVCTARRAALTVAGPCREGDLLGLVDGEVHVIGDDLAEVSRNLLDRMLGGGGELATIVLGADAPAGLEETLRGHVAQTWPFAELHCYAGGQPRYHLLVGVE